MQTSLKLQIIPLFKIFSCVSFAQDTSCPQDTSQDGIDGPAYLFRLLSVTPLLDPKVRDFSSDS